MNVTDANLLIHGLNLLAEAATTLAGGIEQIAWDRIEDHAGALGVRPISAARLENPAAAEAQAELPSQPQSEPDSESETRPETTQEVVSEEVRVSLEQVRGFLADLSRAGKTTQVKELITSFGAGKLSDIPEDRLAALLAAAKELKTDGS